MTRKEILIRADFKNIYSDGEVEDIWEDPAGHNMTFDAAVLLVYGKCKRCPRPCCYPGAIFCGAACSARWEDGDTQDSKS